MSPLAKELELQENLTSSAVAEFFPTFPCIPVCQAVIALISKNTIKSVHSFLILFICTSHKVIFSPSQEKKLLGNQVISNALKM